MRIAVRSQPGIAGSLGNWKFKGGHPCRSPILLLLSKVNVADAIQSIISFSSGVSQLALYVQNIFRGARNVARVVAKDTEGSTRGLSLQNGGNLRFAYIDSGIEDKG